MFSIMFEDEKYVVYKIGEPCARTSCRSFEEAEKYIKSICKKRPEIIAEYNEYGEKTSM